MQQVIEAICRWSGAFVLCWIALGCSLAEAQPFAYVTNTGSHNVSVIDTATNAVVATVPVGTNPIGVAIMPAGAFAYVANSNSHNVSVISTSTNTVVATVPVGLGPFGVAITPDGFLIYVTNFSTNTVSVISTSTNTVVATVPVGLGPSGVAITPDGAFAYVANLNSNNVSVISTSTNAVIATVPVGSRPRNGAVTPDGGFAYVTNFSSNNVSVISTSTNAVVATVPVVNSPFGVAITPVTDTSMEPTLVFLHGSGANANPSVLFLDSAPPTSSTAKYRDSTGVKFAGGNPWKLIGTWGAEPAFTSGTLSELGDLRVWLGLKNSDDQGTRFDLAAELWKNGDLVAEGETLCITDVTRNPSLAKEVTVTFQPFSPVTFNGSSDVLSLKVLTRIGTNGSGGFCGGHSNATGLRLYFDAVDRDAGFSVNPN